MENLPNEKKLVPSEVAGITVKPPLSGSHEAWRLFEAAKLLMLQVEECRIKIKELEKVINESTS